MLMTPLGMPVEPEVKRILATASGRIFWCADSTAGVGLVAASSANGVEFRPGGNAAVTAISVVGGTTFSRAGA